MEHGRARVERQGAILVPDERIKKQKMKEMLQSMQKRRAFNHRDVQGLISGVPQPWDDLHGINSM